MTGAVVRRTAGRRGWVALSAALVLGASAGCSGLPDSRPVETGLAVSAPAEPPLRVVFEGPAEGASPADIVSGFLSASLGTDEGNRAARSYLTPEASNAWVPDRAVVVYKAGSSPEVVATSADTVRIRASVDGELSPDGRFREAPNGTTQTKTITMSQVGGQWRISALPPGFGLWVSQYYFEQLYAPYRVAYVSAVRPQLVSDYRWFPVSSGLTTALAKAQLGPIPAYLTRAVLTGFPANTSLSVDSVPVSEGVGQVSVSESFIGATEEQVKAAWAQTIATLTQARALNSVLLQVNGRAIEPAGLGIPNTVAELGFELPTARAAERVVLRSGTRLRVIEASQLRTEASKPDQGSEKTLTTLEEAWTAVAVNIECTELTAVSGDRTEVRRWTAAESTHPRTVRGFGTALTQPSYDREGWAWVAGRNGSGAPSVWVLDRAQGANPPSVVATPWLAADDRILSLRVAADGQRAAYVVKRANGRILIGVSGIARGPDRGPVALDPPLTVGASISDATSLSWIDELTLAVIGRQVTTDARRPLQVSLSGIASSYPALADTREVGSISGASGLIVRAGGNKLYSPDGRRWESLGTADAVIIPGA